MNSILKKFKTIFTQPLLTQDQRNFWEENGYLILQGFFDKGTMEKLYAEIDKIWNERKREDNPLVIDVQEGPYSGRKKFKDVPDEVRNLAHKLNDLFLVSEEVRSINLDSKLCGILAELLDGDPMVCNSLNFERGSQQRYHFDTYYMPPLVRNKLVVTSICIEDVHPDAGPLCYYPGSHKPSPYIFTHGGLHEIPEEMPAATAYIESEIERLNLKPETFLGKTGDVFIWHAQLYHGGQKIRDHSRTRRSLVTHYWRACDVSPALVKKLKPGQYYLDREHQKVDGKSKGEPPG